MHIPPAWQGSRVFIWMSFSDRLGELTSNTRWHFLFPWGRSSDYVPTANAFPPVVVGSGLILFAVDKGTYSCGTVGDFHSRSLLIAVMRTSFCGKVTKFLRVWPRAARLFRLHFDFLTFSIFEFSQQKPSWESLFFKQMVCTISR